MRSFIRQMDKLEGDIGLTLFTAEMRILSLLYYNGPTTSQQVMAHARVSPAGFHIIKRRLKERGLIHGEKSHADQRRTFYDIPPAVRRRFDDLARTPDDVDSPLPPATAPTFNWRESA